MKNFTPFILIAVAIGLLYVYIMPQFNTIFALQVQKEKYTTALARVKELGSLRDNLTAQYNTLPPDDVKQLSKMIPENFDPVTLVANLNGIAAKYGMSIRAVKIKDQQESNTSREGVLANTEVSLYKTRQFAFGLTGQYKNFVLFLKDLESNLQIIDVRKIAVNSSTVGKSGADDLEYQITIDTYWFK